MINVLIMNLRDKALELHKKFKGKIETKLKVPLETKEDLSLAYTPGVAEPCKEINENPDKVYEYTNKGNLVAVVTDGSAVLGLGNIGGEAGYPVMEGKAALFKKFAAIDAIPICLNTQEPEEIVQIVKALEPTFGGINLEDISAPRCFEIEKRLIDEMNIPVFHDDQHGTAIVVLAGLINALKLVGKNKQDCTVIINGAGAAGVAVTKLLLKWGIGNAIMCDSKGVIHSGRDDLNWIKKDMADITNKHGMQGGLADAMKGSDVFIGVSAPDIVSEQMIQSMNDKPIVFAMANPVPEIMPDKAKAAGAAVVATGRSDFSNQVNNVLAFPGIFRAVLDLRISKITDEMKIASADAIASLIDEDKLNADYVIPGVFDDGVVEAIVTRIKSLTKV